jgi:hypothetical protein
METHRARGFHKRRNAYPYGLVQPAPMGASSTSSVIGGLTADLADQPVALPNGHIPGGVMFSENRSRRLRRVVVPREIQGFECRRALVVPTEEECVDRHAEAPGRQPWSADVAQETSAA